MYLKYFGLTERPFSIAPDPHYLYMSARHKEAMAHLTYGLSQGGCFIVLTGEVGTGKTTLCRNLLTDLPDDVDVALILNADINEQELLQTICDELQIAYPAGDSQKQLLDRINSHLLATFADNRHTVLIIDEAQLLSRDVLEKIRLLTNLETTKAKLLQIILIGQPELSQVLSRNDLRQLAQRVTARYHLGPLQRSEIDDYVNFRLGVAGCKQPLFSRQALNKLHNLSDGIPRKINVLADHSLLSAYSKTQSMVSAKCVKQAAKEVLIGSEKPARLAGGAWRWWALAATLVALNIGLWWWFQAPPPVQNVASSAGSSGESIVRQPASTSGPGGVNELSTVVDEPSLLLPSDDDSANESSLTTIVRSPSIEPGSVVIADAPLDDSPTVATASVASALPAAPVYDPNTAFGGVLDTSADLTGRISAMRNLAQAWDALLPDQMIKPVCDELALQGVRCLSVGSWRQLMRFNRPSILVLQHRDQLHRVIVFKVDGAQAQVLVGEDVHTVSVAELQGRWAKSAMLFWRPGDVGYSFLQRGHTSGALPGVRVQLNQALTVANMPMLQDLESPVFDLDVAQKTFALQTGFGIAADGKIGNETYLLMNELVSPDTTPVLRQRRP